jgi:outer membrane protein assembly factor BamB
MSEHQDFYRPEHIDEQVDALLQARSMPDQDQHMAHDLRMALTNTDADADAHSLQRVLHQLLEGEHSTHRQSVESSPSLEQMHQHPKHGKVIRMKTTHEIVKKPRIVTRVFSTLAAALIFAALVGGMLILSHSVHQHAGTATGAANTTTGAAPASPPQGIYSSSRAAVFRLTTEKKPQVIWQQDLAGVLKIIPIGNVVYVLQSDGQSTNAVLELNANTGKILWKHAFAAQQDSAEPVTMAFAQDQLFVGWRRIINNSQDDGQIDVLNAFNGQQLPFVYAHAFAETMDASNGILAIGNTDLQVYNSTTHKPLWHVSMSGTGIIYSTIISLQVVNNLVYAIFSNNADATGTGTSYIAVYQAATGKQVWQSPNFLGDALYHFAVDQNTVYFGAINTNTDPFTGHVYAYDIQSNKQLWSTPVNGGAQEALAISNGTLYTAADRGGKLDAYLIALDAATGKIKWQQTLDTVVLQGFSLSNGIIYTGRYVGEPAMSGPNANASIEAFKADSGQKLWEDAQYGNTNLVATD